MKSTWADANRLALDGSYWVMSLGGGRRSAGKRDGGGFTSHDDGRGAQRDGIVNVAGKRRASTRRLFDQTQDSFKLLGVGTSIPRVSEAGSDPTMMKSSCQINRKRKRPGSSTFSPLFTASCWHWSFVPSTFHRFRRRQKQGGANTWQGEESLCSRSFEQITR